MTDRLYLSYWLNDFTGIRMMSSFEKVLRAFPHSQRSAGHAILRVQPVSLAEPPSFERSLPMPVDVDAFAADFREYQGFDCATTVETAWDLWQFDEEWKLTPTPVLLQCFGPDFASEEQILVDFGPDVHFLPQPHLPNAFKPVEQNVQSLLRLSGDLDTILRASRRQLWSESGANFADKLKQSLQ